MEALPEELLMIIFSFFSWNELKILSLVNRRWYRLTGTASLIAGTYLCLSKVRPNNNLRANEDSYIDRQLLVDSHRQYESVSIEIFFTEDILIKKTLLGILLETCLSRWSVKTLRITGHYEHLVLFLQRYDYCFAELLELEIVLEPFEDSEHYQVGEHEPKICLLDLRQLQNLNWSERSLPSRSCQMPHSFTFTVPRLKNLRVNRLVLHEDNLMMFDCTALRTAHLNCYSLLGSSMFDSDILNLKQLTIDGYAFKDHELADSSRLLKNLIWLNLTRPAPEDLRIVSRYAKELKSLKLAVLQEAISIEFLMMQQLYELHLESIELLPTATPIDCPNLCKLTLLRIKCSTTLQLNAPKLDALIAEETVFKFLRLRDYHVVRRLGILRGYKAQEITIPEFPNVSQLYLELLPGTSKRKRSLGFRTTRVTKLTVLNSSIEDSLDDILKELPNVEVLHLHSGSNLPNKIEATHLKV